MRAKSGTFSGGYRFRNFAGQPAEKLVETGIPEKVKIPLPQGVPPIVKPGESVRAGQIISVDDVSNPVHSTVNGVVEEIVTIEYPEGEILAVAVKSDGTSDWQTLGSAGADWADLSREALGEIIYLSGAASLDSEGIPTGQKSSIPPDQIQHIIIRGVGSEIYNPSINLLLSGDKISHFVQGLSILRKVMPSARLHLALNAHNRRLIRRIVPLIEGCEWIDVFRLKPKYPQELDEVIISTILDQNLSAGGSAAQMGVVVLSVQTILHVYDAVVEGRPVIEGIIALGGMGFRETCHVRVRIGAPLEHLIGDRIDANSEVRIVLNSLLTGENLPDLSLPVDRRFTSVIALPEEKERQFFAFLRPGFRKDSYSHTFFPVFNKRCGTNLHGEERPCISCGYCDEVCPAGIIPHLIYRHIERDAIDETLNLRIFDCIECNLCDYVCPSKLPLAGTIKEGKKRLSR